MINFTTQIGIEKCAGILLSFQVNKWAYYCFMSARKRHETTGSETKTLFIARSVVGASCPFALVPHFPQVLQGWHRESIMVVCIPGGLCYRRWTLNMKNSYFYSWGKQTCSLAGGDVTSSLKVACLIYKPGKWDKNGQGLIFLAYLPRSCRDTQGPWQIAFTNSKYNCQRY